MCIFCSQGRAVLEVKLLLIAVHLQCCNTLIVCLNIATKAVTATSKTSDVNGNRSGRLQVTSTRNISPEQSSQGQTHEKTVALLHQFDVVH